MVLTWDVGDMVEPDQGMGAALRAIAAQQAPRRPPEGIELPYQRLVCVLDGVEAGEPQALGEDQSSRLRAHRGRGLRCSLAGGVPDKYTPYGGRGGRAGQWQESEARG